MTEQQWRVLRTLSTIEALEVLELAEATNLLAPSLSRIISDLETRGLISRRSVAHDLRRAEISITAKGKELIEAMEPHSDAIYGEILKAGRERMEQLQTLLKELTYELEQLPAVQPGLDQITTEQLKLSGSPQRGRPRRSMAT